MNTVKNTVESFFSFLRSLFQKNFYSEMDKQLRRGAAELPYSA